jgi:heptaprenyl diphosphate synthase
MPSRSEVAGTAREDALVAGFAALAVAVAVLESAVPMPLPGLKPGLANLVVLVVLLRHGLRLAAWVAVLRIVVGSLALGTFLTPGFALSLAGGAASFAALAAVHAAGRGAVGPIGYSAASALAHMAGQLGAAALLLVPPAALAPLVPWLLAFATVAGIVGGTIAHIVLRRLPPP